MGRGNRPRKRLERVCENVGFFRGLKAAEHGWGTETVRDERLGSRREGRPGCKGSHSGPDISVYTASIPP